MCLNVPCSKIFFAVWHRITVRNEESAESTEPLAQPPYRPTWLPAHTRFPAPSNQLVELVRPQQSKKSSPSLSSMLFVH